MVAGCGLVRPFAIRERWDRFRPAFTLNAASVIPRYSRHAATGALPVSMASMTSAGIVKSLSFLALSAAAMSAMSRRLRSGIGRCEAAAMIAERFSSGTSGSKAVRLPWLAELTASPPVAGAMALVVHVSLAFRAFLRAIPGLSQGRYRLAGEWLRAGRGAALPGFQSMHQAPPVAPEAYEP